MGAVGCLIAAWDRPLLGGNRFDTRSASSRDDLADLDCPGHQHLGRTAILLGQLRLDVFEHLTRGHQKLVCSIDGQHAAVIDQEALVNELVACLLQSLIAIPE
jgi:hypothetical protein